FLSQGPGPPVNKWQRAPPERLRRPPRVIRLTLRGYGRECVYRVRRRHSQRTRMRLTRCSFVRLLALAAILLLGIPAQAAQPGGPEMFRVSAGRPGAIIEAPSGQEEAELLAFDSSFTAKMLALAPEESLRADDWPIAPGVRRSVVLTRRDIYAPDARIVMMEGGREVELPRSRLAFFLGEIQDGTQGRVMVSIDPDTGTLGGFSATNEGDFEIG